MEGFIKMKNTKILEMLNDGYVEELKKLIQEEIFIEELKNKPGAKQRYTAMKKYFSYTKNVSPSLQKPCMIDFYGEKYISFVNGYSIALTKESSGEMELFENLEKYINVQNMIKFDEKEEELDINAIIAKAKSKEYKLKKSEVEQNGDFKYIFHYNNTYFKIGLLDCTYSIINDGGKSHSMEIRR